MLYASPHLDVLLTNFSARLPVCGYKTDYMANQGELEMFYDLLDTSQVDGCCDVGNSDYVAPVHT